MESISFPIKWVLVRPGAKVPEYAHKTDSGFDFICPESVTLESGVVKKIPTGLIVEMPISYEGIGFIMELQIRSRSGLSSKHGIMVINSPSTIDNGYRGEISIPIIKLTPGSHTFKPGDKFAQGVFAPVFSSAFLSFKQVALEEITGSERGAGGFGSTG